MIKRNYYSVRTGKISPGQELNLDILKQMFLIVYNKLEEECYFQKYFGYHCVDAGDVQGKLGYDIEGIFYINLKKTSLYPIRPNIESYNEDDLFDVIEFLHDHCSKGISGYYHSWNDCGQHYEEFNDSEGQGYFRDLINPLLKDYQTGFEISKNGEILTLSDEGLANLFEADIPSSDAENVKDKINNAINKFRRYKSTLDDRREAIRELADVLEFLRPQIKQIMSKQDESDLFNIANNFGIRHHNSKQQTDYDKPIWYSWIFYYYLATLHALLRMIEKQSKNQPT